MVKNMFRTRRHYYDQFKPQGREQADKTALVLSPLEYNEKVGLAILCPITNQTKRYPFETITEKEITGVVLSIM